MRRLLPEWGQTIRFRLTAAYSIVLFGLSAAALAAVYLVLSNTVEAAPLEPLRIQPVRVEVVPESGTPVPDGTVIPSGKVWHAEDRWYVDEQASFKAADIEAVEAAVNYELLELVRRFSVVALAGLLVASLVTGWWLSGRVLRPVRHITATAREISGTDLSRRIDLGGPRDELRALADTLDSMLSRLHESFTAQRQLIDDASHELRNPLAVIQANVDAVLGQHDVPPDTRAQAATVVSRAVDRMRHVVEDLLSAARRRSPAFVDEAVDLARVAGEVAEEYAVLARQRGLELVRRCTGRPVVAGDPQAIHRAAANLLSNAIRVSADRVTLGVGCADGWAWLAVRDQGPGIPAEERDRIFDRYRTSEPAGTGLGLAIVRQVAESHDGMVTAQSQHGSLFVLWLPERSAEGVSRRSPEPPPVTFDDQLSSSSP